MKSFSRKLFLAAWIWAIPMVTYAQDRTFSNPLTGKAEPLSIAQSIGRVIQAILGISGVAAALVIIVAGLRVVFSQGSEDAITQGKQAIVWAVVGLIVAFGGYMIIGLILESASSFLQ